MVNGLGDVLSIPGVLLTFDEVILDVSNHPHCSNITGDEQGACRQTPLLYTVETGQVTAVQLLLAQNSIDVNSRNGNRWMPLSIVANNGCLQVVNALLVREGVNINSRDNKGWTALSPAAN